MTNILKPIFDKIQDAINEVGHTAEIAGLHGADSGAGQEAEANRILDAFIAEMSKPPYSRKPEEYDSGCAILEADPRFQITVVFAMLQMPSNAYRVAGLRNLLMARNLPWTTGDLEHLLELRRDAQVYFIGDVLRPIQYYKTQGNALTPKMTEILRVMQTTADNEAGADARKMLVRINALLGEEKSVLPEAGEAWADAALADNEKLLGAEQTAWKKLFAQAQDSEAGKPSAAWSKEARTCIAGVGEEAFRQSVVRWFGLVTMPAMKTLRHEYEGGRVYEHQVSSGSDRNINILKGLAWMCADRTETEVARALAKLIEAGLKKQPGIGPWAVRAVNAAIWALTEMDSSEAVGQLGRLKTKVTFRTALNQIEKGLEVAAKRAGVTKADLEDLSVPTYGFDQSGTRREEFGESAGVATLTPSGEINIAWFAASDKPVKAPTADAKKNFAAELKAFKADMDAAGKMLTAQKSRFDGFYLPERVWKLSDWRERFGNHPLLANLCGRLIWHLSDADDREKKAQGLWNTAGAGFNDVDGQPITWLTDATEIRLWHPIGFEVETVLRWRDALQKANIAQPFKQAYREVYLLTEAELRTETYSNRFAGHILKQHQMNSLAALRGWKNPLRLMVDDSYPPATKELPELGLRAEFWIEGVGDNYGVDTTESGSYLYLATDQVRFYRTDTAVNTIHASGGAYGVGYGANPQPSASLPLVDVPALAFSEILRDVDMFVGVCSVGNDPQWQDGGPQGRYRDYWTDYSFGDLSATAQTRRQVLEKILPRLKIADRAALTDKFLTVRGDIRTYKIHLGSGNILMEPNDQYLCIVQDRSAVKDEAQPGFLPFEGDQRLALILSKALLLAEDKKITDETITRQIRG